MRTISVKLYKIYTSGSGGDAIKNIFFIYRSGYNLVQGSRTISAILVEGITCMKNISVKLFLIWTGGSGDVA